MQLTYKAPCAKLVKLENLWFQLSNVACNIKCKHCYLDCYQNTKKKNFLSIDKVINILKFNLNDLKRIYLTGGEPFLHPKINDILRLCLQKSNVTICTNGTLLNEKKIKVLKNIEDETHNKILIRLSLDHFTEGRNDEYRARGVFKKVINASTILQRYGIKYDLICVNLKNEDENILKNGFVSLFTRHKLNLDLNDIKILPMLKMGNYAKYYNISEIHKHVTFEDIKNFDMEILDCKNSRVVTINGIYSCPALVNDPRGKLGETLQDSSCNVYLETQTCFDCVKRQDKLFG